MSDPRLPLEEGDIDLGEIEDEDQEVAPDEDGDDAAEADAGSETDALADDEEGEAQRDVGTRRGGGGSRTIRNLRSELQAERAERAKLAQQIEALSTRFSQPPVDPAAQARAAREEQERLELMSPQEVARYYYEKGQQEHRQQLLQVQITTADSMDRQNYATLKAQLPAASRLETQVEQLLRTERAAGNYRFTRQDILRYLVGQEVLEKRASVLPRQQRQGARRVAGQTTRPNGGRGDVARQDRAGRSQDDADAALLRGTRVADL